MLFNEAKGCYRLEAVVRTSVAAPLRAYADSRGISITEAVRRAGAVLNFIRFEIIQPEAYLGFRAESHGLSIWHRIDDFHQLVQIVETAPPDVNSTVKLHVNVAPDVAAVYTGYAADEQIDESLALEHAVRLLLWLNLRISSGMPVNIYRASGDHVHGFPIVLIGAIPPEDLKYYQKAN